MLGFAAVTTVVRAGRVQTIPAFAMDTVCCSIASNSECWSSEISAIKGPEGRVLKTTANIRQLETGPHHRFISVLYAGLLFNSHAAQVSLGSGVIQRVYTRHILQTTEFAATFLVTPARRSRKVPGLEPLSPGFGP